MILGVNIAAIEFADDEVRVAVVSAKGRTPTLLEVRSARALYDTPEARPEALASTLDGLLGALRNQPSAYIFVANCLFGVARALTIPFRGKRRVAGAVRFELEPFLAFPIDELMVDFNVVTEVEGETEVLAMGIRRSYAEEQIGVLGGAGVAPDSIALDAVALTGLWIAQQNKPRGLNAVLHVRENGAMLAFTFNETLAYFRSLDMPPARLIDDPAAAAREIQNTLRAFLAKWRGGGVVERIHVTGLDLAPAERDALSKALSLPVQSASMIASVSGSAVALADGEDAVKWNRFEACIGAALGAAGAYPAIDFKREEQGAEQSVRGAIPHLLFSSCLALLALMGWAFYYYQGAAQFERSAADLQSKITALQAQIEEKKKLGLPDVNTSTYNDPAVLDVLREVAEMIPETKAKIQNIRVGSPGAHGAWLTITGTADQASALSEIVGKLATAKTFVVDGEPEKRVEGGIITFIIKARRIHEEAPADEEAPAAEPAPEKGTKPRAKA